MPTFIPVVLQNYNVGSRYSLDAPGLGHAGYMVVDGTGNSTYYEFGRYNPAKEIGLITNNPKGYTEGNLRRTTAGKVTFGADGKVTSASLKQALDTVFGTSGLYKADVGAATVAQFQMSGAQSTKLGNWFDSLPSQVNGGKLSYSIFSTNCMQFVYNAAAAAGIVISPKQNSPLTAVPSLAVADMIATANGGYQYFGPKSWMGNSISPLTGVAGISSLADRVALIKDSLWQASIAMEGWFDFAVTKLYATFTTDTSTGLPTSLNFKSSTGVLLQKVSFYDDMKFKLTRFNSAGARTSETLLDPGNEAGDSSSGYRIEGGFTKASYYNSDGVRAFVRTLWADGTKTKVTFDPANSQTWAEKTTNYNTAGDAIYVRTIHDDGKKTVVNYDPENKQSWKTVKSTYDAEGHRTKEVKTNDDGTKTVTNYNANTQQVTSWTTFNAAGTVIGSSDSGSSGNGGNNQGGIGGSEDITEPTSGWEHPDITVSFPNQAPVLLDLNRDDHIDLRPFDPAELSGPQFDWDGDGTGDRTAWAGPEDGWLAIDLAADGSSGSDGVIDQAKELGFAIWEKPNQPDGEQISDLDGLRLQFDTNHNNLLDAGDLRWNEFRVWQDANQNGISENGELRTLEQADIRLIELLPSSDGARQFSDGSFMSGTSGYTRTDGSRGLVGDVTLAYSSSRQQSTLV